MAPLRPRTAMHDPIGCCLAVILDLPKPRITESYHCNMCQVHIIHIAKAVYRYPRDAPVRILFSAIRMLTTLTTVNPLLHVTSS